MNGHLIMVHQVDTEITFHVRPSSGMWYGGRIHISTMSISPPIGQFSPALVSEDHTTAPREFAVPMVQKASEADVD